jgi:hypothetical protein
MKKCNKCLKEKPSSKFLTNKKLTCKKCEYRFKQRFLRSLVHNRKLKPVERIANRLGYMGTGFFITAPHLLPETPGLVIYFLAGLFCTPQVWVAKQWNLVLVNLNVMIAYALLFFK